jgi:hypothetical protein
MDIVNAAFWARQRTDHGPVLPPPDTLDEQWSAAGTWE